MAGSLQLIYLIIKKILNIINWLNLNFCNSYLLKFPLKKEENSMKESLNLGTFYRKQMCSGSFVLNLIMKFIYVSCHGK